MPMNSSCITPDFVTEPGWFCLRSRPKHEHIAAANLRQSLGIDVYCPRFRIRRATRRGVVWFTESLFPNYLFARFHFDLILQVKYTEGISSIVRFGDRTPRVPEFVINELRQEFPEEQLQVFGDDLQAGDEVTIAEGPFMGLKAVVLRILKAPQRVHVLLDLLGRTTAVEVDRQCLISEKRHCFSAA